MSEVQGQGNAHKESGVKVGAILTPYAAFGIDSNVKHNVHHLDADIITFPVGRHICTFNLDSREMTFLMETEKVKQIIAMCVSPNRKYIAAIEELEDEYHQFSVWNIQTEKRVRTLMIGSEIQQSPHLSCIAFSADSKSLLIMGSSPDYVVSCWKWYIGKVVSSIVVGTEIDCITFNPEDINNFMTTGPKTLQIWQIDKETKEIVGTNLAPSKKEFSGTYTFHAWLSGGQLAVTTSVGKILIFERGEVQGVVPPAEEGLGIIAIYAVARGFMAFTNSGELLLYEVALMMTVSGSSKGGGGFTLSKRLRPLLAPQWGSLSLTGDHLVCTSLDGDICKITLANLESESNEPQSELLCGGFHRGGVVSMDVCATRPLFITAGQDKTVRIWNLVDKTCRLVQRLPADVSVVAIHPSGFYVLVGMTDKLRLYNVTRDTLLQLREFHVPGCKVAKFSHGGHLFAAVNKTVIQVYATYSTNVDTQVLKGHSAAVTDLSWSANDLRMASCSAAGEIFEWRVDTMLRDHARENIQRGCIYNSVCYNHSAGAVVAVGSDFRLRHLVGGNVEFETSTLTKEAPHGVEVTGLVLGRDDRMLLAATAQGAVRSYMWTANPTIRNPLDGTFHDLHLHHAPITAMCLTPDQNFALTTDHNGTIFVCMVEFVVDGRLTEKTPVEKGRDLMVVAREELEENDALTGELKGKLESTKSEYDFILMRKEREGRQKVEALQEQVRVLTLSNEAVNSELARVREIMVKEIGSRVSLLERAHMQAAEELENLYEKKLSKEAEKYLKLEEKRADELYAAAEKLRIAVDQERRKMAELDQKFVEQLAKERSKQSKVEEEKTDVQAVADELLNQTEQDCDTDIENVKKQFEETFERTDVLNTRLKADNALMHRGMEKLRAQIEEQVAMSQQKEAEKEVLKLEINELDEVIDDLRKQLAARNLMIENKEDGIADVKGKLKDVENQKYILNYKVDSLSKAAAPREMKLDRMEEKMKEMDQDLQGQMSNLQRQKHLNRDLKGRIKAMDEEVRALRNTVRDRETYVKGFCFDLNRVMEMPHGRKEGEREEALRYMHRVYVQEEEKAKEKDDGLTQELMQQHHHLQHKNKFLAHKAEYAEFSKVAEGRKGRQENKALLQDLADSAKDNLKLRQEVFDLKLQNKDFERVKARTLKASQRTSLLPTASGSSPPKGEEGGGGLGGSPPSAGDTLTAGSKVKATARSGSSRSRPVSALNPLEEDTAGPGHYASALSRRASSGRTAGVAPGGGRLMSGATSRAINELVSMERDRILELVSQLEHQHRQMEEQQREINMLKDHLVGEDGRPLSGVSSRPHSGASLAHNHNHHHNHNRPISRASTHGSTQRPLSGVSNWDYDRVRDFFPLDDSLNPSLDQTDTRPASAGLTPEQIMAAAGMRPNGADLRGERPGSAVEVVRRPPSAPHAHFGELSRRPPTASGPRGTRPNAIPRPHTAAPLRAMSGAMVQNRS